MFPPLFFTKSAKKGFTPLEDMGQKENNKTCYPLTGFTFLEVMIVMAVLAILIAVSATAFIFIRKKADLDNSAQEIINILRIAQNKTLSSEGASQYGVYFNDTGPLYQYTLFKGASYGSDVSQDKTYKLSSGVEISGINLGEGKEVVFKRLTGEAIPAGNIIVRLKNNPSFFFTIYIEDSGEVGLTTPISPTISGLIKDSRHAHFNLGWNIQNATTLKFYFPTAGQTETVNMADYFDGAKTEFNWSGKFSVAGTDQVFQVHTHLLDPLTSPYARLCIHRDRNNGENNREVIVYIVDGGTDKEIAHYFIDGTVIKGLYGGTMEIQ